MSFLFPKHAASVGRHSGAPLASIVGTPNERASTNTLGELKIPARISRAQQGLRRDLGMVREFAGCVEQLKRLQATYMKLIEELCTAYEAYPTPAQKVQPLPLLLNSPTKAHASRSFSRSSNDLNRELARLEQDYGIWWECAELLVELGGGTTTANAGIVTASNPNLSTHSSSSALALNIQAQAEESMPRAGNHTPSMSDPGSIFESAAANGKTPGPPQASPPNPMQWRASTGRHDLSARQLRLLKDMLNTPDPATLADTAAAYDSSCPPSAFPYPSAGVEGQPWAAWNPSMLTLPSEESSADLDVDVDADAKRRRVSKLGMLGLRDLLRGLKRTAVAEGRLPQRSDSSLGSNLDDDHYNRRRSPWHQHESHHTHDPPEPASTRIIPAKSPRRPSLASIFRLGYKSAKNSASAVKTKDDVVPGENRNPSLEDDRPNDHGLDGYGDWDRMSRSDLDLTAVGTGIATVRGRKTAKSPTLFSANLHPYAHQGATTPKKAPCAASQTSLRESPPVSQPRGPLSTTLDADNGQRLKGILTSRPSNSKQRTSSWSQAHLPPPRSPSRNGKVAMSGTVRSAPPTDISPPDPKLSLTPENIKPLLEYAKEVSTRLTDCISEVQTLLGVGGSGPA
ncbi:hypothetical protein BU17DRAFT_45360 [Hysterangium stoloniferum]|nr:hypothetical protein BU17DRAFT_45360 [Hysterangium stoloniferum]